MRRTHVKIYQSRWHLILTFFILAAPFLFFIFFSQIAQIAGPELITHIAFSILRLAIAYVIAASLAWLSAIFFYKGKRAAVILPIFDVLQSFPLFAALPLATFFWGQSNFTVIFFLVLAIIWPIFFSLISSLKLIHRDWEDAVKISKLKGFRYIWRFVLPVSIPGLITGSIIGLGEGWEALVATEIIVSIKTGVGSFFNRFSHDATLTAFGIFGLLLIIFALNKLLWLPLLEWSHRKMEE